jgi:hypothetical protein
MNILILGDSFCRYDNNGTWPNELRKIGHTVTCIGEGGCSNYVILEKFRKYYNSSYDYIIVLLTSENRIPKVNGPNYWCNHLPAEKRWRNNKQIPSGFEDAVEGWLKYIHDDTFLRWVVTSGMNEIETTILPHQTIIWVDAILTDSTIIDSAKTGIKLKGSLRIPAFKELINCKLTLQDYCDLSRTKSELRKNHFTECNQHVLAKFLDSVLYKHKNKLLTDHDLDLLNTPPWVTDHEQLYPQLFPEDYVGKEYGR